MSEQRPYSGTFSENDLTISNKFTEITPKVGDNITANNELHSAFVLKICPTF